MKRILCSILALVMLAAAGFVMVGCDTDDNGDIPGDIPADTPPPADANDLPGTAGAPPQIGGTLRMATNAEFPPFEYFDDDGNIVGFDVDLAQAIADLLGMELVIEHMGFEAVLGAVATGEADVAIAALTITPERAESVHFTIPYFETDLVVIVVEDSDITSPDGVGDLHIAVQLGTTSDIWVEANLPDAELTRLRSAPDTVLELTAGNVDAIIIDREVANQFVAENPGLRVLDEAIGVESYGMAVALDNEELLGHLNAALEYIKATGIYEQLILARFGE